MPSLGSGLETIPFLSSLSTWCVLGCHPVQLEPQENTDRYVFIFVCSDKCSGENVEPRVTCLIAGHSEGLSEVVTVLNKNFN